MPQRFNKRLGKNALVSTLLKNVMPNQRFRDQHPNNYRIRRGKFIVQDYRTRDDGKKVIIVKHPDHGDDTFEILPGNCRLDRAGPPNQFFIQAPPPAQQGQQQPAVQQNVADGEQEEEVADEAVADGQINQFIPPTAAHGWAWEEFRDSMTTDWRGVAAKTDAHMLIGGLQARDMSPIHFFDAFFPYEYVRDEVIPATNNILKERDHRETTMEEMKIFLGLWTIISLNPGYNARDFFLVEPPRNRDFLWNPPYLGGIISRKRFDLIQDSIRLRNEEPPQQYRDKFWHVRKLIKAFNDKMTATFGPSWLTCLDEIMVVFFNAFAPGWMNVKRKPHPFGNEYHTIACCDTHIIFYIEIMEGKDRPSQGPDSVAEFEEKGATPGLVTRMTRTIWGSSRVVLLDSGFGYLPCLQALKGKGLYSTCVIKKHAYWPAGTEGNKLLEEMSGREVGSIRIREGVKDGCRVWIAAMADSKHTAIMANTWSTTLEKGDKRKRRVGGNLVDISYGEYQHYYYYGRHAVDDNNNNRQGVLPFEEAYQPKRWDLRQFGFVCALAMTNSHLAYNYFVRHKNGDEPWSKAEFTRELARGLVQSGGNPNEEDEDLEQVLCCLRDAA